MQSKQRAVRPSRLKIFFCSLNFHVFICTDITMFIWICELSCVRDTEICEKYFISNNIYLLHAEEKHKWKIQRSISNPIIGLDRPWGFQEVEAPRFTDNRHMKVVRLSALCTGRLYPPGNIPGIHFCWRLSQPQGYSAAGRIMSMKNSIDTIGNRTRDLPTCSAVPQPIGPPRAPLPRSIEYRILVWNP